MRKTIKFITFIIISVILLFVVSCSRESTNKIYNIDMSGVVFEDKTYTYDGNVHNIYISGAIPSGVIVSYTGNSKVNVGTYEVTASFKLANGYTKIPDMKANMIIEKAPVTGIQFESKTFEYDGLPHSLAIEGDLPQSLAVDYRYNSATEVGVYEVEAHFSSTENNSNFVVPEPMKAKMTITKQAINNISFENKTFKYDGKLHSIGIDGILPRGVNVNYEGNGKAAVGEYEVTANFNDTTGNYSIENMTAIMTIEKDDISGISFKNSSAIYDGNEHKIEVSNLPEGIEVSYSPTNTFINAGRHVVTASFKDTTGNYNVPDDMTATLTIAQQSLPVEFNSKEVTYDGLAHSIEIEESLPEGITVSYSQNSFTDVGVYEVTASFEDINNNYLIEDMTAFLTINKADLIGLSLENKTVTYDGTPKSIEITGELNDSISTLTEYSIEFKNNNKTNAGTYYVYATITPSNNNFNPLVLDAILIIDKADIVGISMKDVTVDYDGTPKSITVTGDVPSGIVVDYYYNGNILDPGEIGVIKAGVYTIKAVLREEITSNYKSSEDLTATLTINKVKPDKEIEFNDAVFNYDNKAHSIFIDEDDLPEFIRVSKYTNNAAVRMGEYVVVAYLVDDSGNYDIPDSISATMRIYYIEDDIYYIGNEQTKTATVAGCKDGVTEVEIKSSISVFGASYIVNGIEVGAFKDTANRHVTKISVPRSVKNLEKGVFSGSSSLESISLPFVGNKEHYDYENDQYPFGYIFGTETYKGASPIRQVYKTGNDTKGDTVYYIPSSLKNITIGDSENCQEFIPYGSFSYLTNVENIEIGPAVEISDSAFEGISGLKNLKVPYLGSSSDGTKTLGYLFSSSGYYGGISVIQNNDIYCYPETLETVNIYLATSVGVEAFRNCSSLKFILIPETITNIGNSAFSGCNKKLKICYKGNSGDFANIDKGDDNELLDTNVYYYTDHPETEEGAMWWYYGANGEIYTKVLVTFNSNGGTNVSPQATTFNGKITKPTITLEKDYCEFEDWYIDSELNEKFDFDTDTITENITLYAKWTEYLAYELVNNEYYKVLGRGAVNSSTIDIPDTYKGLPVKVIGEYAFEYNNVYNQHSSFDNSNITSVTIGANVETIEQFAFYQSSINGIDIPDSVKTIGKQAFYLSHITNVNFGIGSGLETIGDYAFSKCWYLTEIIIPDTVTQLGNYAFEECKIAEKITIGTGLKTISYHAFSWCSKLETLDLSNEVKKIADSAFYGCSKLTEIIIPDSVTELGSNAFNSCTEAKKVIIGAGLATIPYAAFAGCSGLETLDLGNVTTIADSAFSGCSKLTEIIIPDTVTKLGDESFARCKEAKRIIIGAGLATIPNGAFREATNANEIIFKSTEVITLYYSSFRGVHVNRFVISSTKIKIRIGAFVDASIKELVLENVKELVREKLYDVEGNSPAFVDASIEGLVLGKSPEKIGESVFGQCDLQRVYYCGSPYESWASDTVGANNDSLNFDTKRDTWYYFTSNGADETDSDYNWWYYDSDKNIIEVVDE